MVLQDLRHRPRLSSHELFRVCNVICSSGLRLTIGIDSEALSDCFSAYLHGITLVHHALVNTSFELHAADHTLLETTHRLLELLSGLFEGLLRNDSVLVSGASAHQGLTAASI